MIKILCVFASILCVFASIVLFAGCCRVFGICTSVDVHTSIDSQEKYAQNQGSNQFAALGATNPGACTMASR
ncbi:MAG TPA: hypothetical protein VMA09_18510 [Candidatus Binataceae bacterium]|nr:hypothetical protein [Candidatus Binataceae bacterium]